MRTRCCARSTRSRSASCARGRCGSLLTALRRRARRRDGLRRAAAGRHDPRDLRRAHRLARGASTDLIVMRRGRGTHARATRSTACKRDRRASRTRPGWSAACSRGWTADGSPVKGLKGQMLIAGYEHERDTSPTTSASSRGAGSATGREMMVEQNWARERGYDVGDRVRVAGPTGRRELPIVGIFSFTSGLNVRRARAMRRCRCATRAAADRRAAAAGCRSRSWRTTGATSARQEAGQAACSAPGATCRRRRRRLGRDRQSSSQALNIVLYFFSGIALFVGGFLILNSFNMTVLQRMRELGMLRTLGASRGMVTRTVLTEALARRHRRHGARARARPRPRVRADRADARHRRAGRHAARQRRRARSRPLHRHRRDAAGAFWPARRAGRDLARSARRSATAQCAARRRAPRCA